MLKFLKVFYKSFDESVLDQPENFSWFVLPICSVFGFISSLCLYIVYGSGVVDFLVIFFIIGILFTLGYFVICWMLVFIGMILHDIFSNSFRIWKKLYETIMRDMEVEDV